jgi:hypothetical protein
MAINSDCSIEGIDQVAATITAALVAKSPKADELGAVNLFFKTRALLIEHEKLQPQLAQTKTPTPRR